MRASSAKHKLIYQLRLLKCIPPLGHHCRDLSADGFQYPCGFIITGTSPDKPSALCFSIFFSAYLSGTGRIWQYRNGAGNIFLLIPNA